MNPINRIRSTLIAIILPILTFAQQYSISGVVQDEYNQPVSYANVVLMKQKDSTFVSGSSTDEQGAFLFDGLKKNDYILTISFLGFDSFSNTFTIDDNIDLKTIVLTEKTQELDGVIVVAKRPTVKRLVDRLVFDVENSTLSENNLLDILKQTPGVLYHDGNITVKNSIPTVYINDRKVHLSSSEVLQLLESTSATNIKSIEVITNPPAKYEAEGGAVLNIVTSKNVIAGYNGSIFGNYKQGEKFPKYSVGTSHFFKTETLNVYLNYNVSPRKDYRQIYEFINFIENDNVISSWETDYRRTQESFNHNINANVDININKNNSIGISTNILLFPKSNTKRRVNSITEVFSSSHALDSLFNSENDLTDKKSNLAFTLDYIHKFKNKGEQISLSAHHTNYDFSGDQFVNTDYFYPDNTLIRNNSFQTLSGQKIKLYTGQVDYETPLKNNGKLESGAKVSSIDSESDLSQLNFQNGQPVLDLQNSDTFLYDEQNYAAYVSFTKDWESWNLKSGLRLEYTDLSGNSLSTNQINKNDYVELFPSFYISKKINDKNQIYFNYNRRIFRPRYSELNPFKYFLNDNTFITGNPNLKPQLDDILTLGYTLNNTYTFEIYYRNEKHPTQEITFQDNDNMLIKRIYTNIDKNISYGLDFTTYTKIIQHWNLYAYSSIFYYEGHFFALESNNELLTNDKWSIITQIINYFSFLKDKSLTADVSFLYISPVVDGPTNISSRSGIDINLKKTLWNNRASVSIGITDIFNTLDFTQRTRYLNQDEFLKSSIENRMITFGFNYKFGNVGLKNNQKEIDLNERDRLDSRN